MDFEREIERIQILQQDCFSDDNLNKIATIPGYLDDIEKMQCILRLQQRLSSIKSSSGYIDDVYVFIPAIGEKISATTFYDLNTEEYKRLKTADLYSKAKIFEIEEKMFLSASYPLGSIRSEKGPIFTLVVEMSKDRIEGALNSMINSEAEGILLVNKADKYIISTKHDSGFNDKILGFLKDNKELTNKNAVTIKIDGNRYLAVYSTSNFLGDILCKYVPEDSVFKSLRRYQAWFVLLTAVALAIVITYSMYIYKFIHKPLDRLAKSFKQVENGDFNVPIEHRHDDEFRYIYRRFNIMVENVNALIDQVYKQRILAQKAELKQLQSQINPHFLYNSFFILNTMSRVGDYDNLEKFTEQLGEYFQFITRSAADEITLLKEVNHARVYTEIQTMRFSNRIRVEFDDLPMELSKIIVPRLILQPIIENAFEHGLEKKSSNGILKISFRKLNNEFCIIIEDNGEELGEGDLENLRSDLRNETNNNEVTGIININERLRLKFGNESGIDVKRGEMGGLKVKIHIKLAEGDGYVQVTGS
jgi:two-component system sensor histidine kinase YesM